MADSPGLSTTDRQNILYILISFHKCAVQVVETLLKCIHEAHSVNLRQVISLLHERGLLGDWLGSLTRIILLSSVRSSTSQLTLVVVLLCQPSRLV
jgi:hypothetical protein